MTELEKKIRAKIPGEDTGITVRSGCCDICAPGPHCGVDAYIKDGRILKLEGTPGHPANHGMLCPKGQAGRQYVYRADRIRTPLKKVDGQFVPIGWDEALDTIAARLNTIKAESGAESVAFFSGYNKWYRPYLQRLAYSFGTPNYGTESSSCFTATTMSWNIAAGYDAAMPDLGRAGVYLGWCANPYHGMYLMVDGLQKRKAQGMKIIIVDPRVSTAVDKLADLHLRPRPGTDGALALGLARELLIHDWYDRDYVAEHVYGFEAYRDYALGFDPERVERLTGVPAEQLRTAAKLLWENRPMAINQSSAALVHHKNGMQNHRAVMALSALLGSFDRPGGVIPNTLTYAHSMGGFATRDHQFSWATYPNDAPKPVGCDCFPLWHKLVGEMQACDLSRQIVEGTPYPIRAVVGHGLNFRMFNGSDAMRAALEQVEFFVDIDLFMTDTAKLADLVLPACTSYERGEFKVYGGGFVQYTAPIIDRLYEARPDTEIIVELARRIAPQDELLCAGYDACLRWMLQDLDVDLDELKANSQRPQRLRGFVPVPPGKHPFRTPTGKFELYSTVIEQLGVPGLNPLPTYSEGLDDAEAAAYPLVMMGGVRLPTALHSRVHDVPWLRSLRPEPAADLSLEDAAALGIQRLDRIRISTPYGEIHVRANPSARILPGTVALYHGYREADVNSLMSPTHNDPYSGFPGYRSFRCRIDKEAL